MSRSRPRWATAAVTGLRIDYSDEGPEPLETGGGIFRALPLLQEGADEPFLVLNGDVWMDYPYAATARTLRRRPARADLAHLVLVPNPAHNPHGDFLLQGGRMLEPAPVPAPPPRPARRRNRGACEDPAPRFTFSGLGVYRAKLFAGCTRWRFPARAAAARRRRGRAASAPSSTPGDWPTSAPPSASPPR